MWLTIWTVMSFVKNCNAQSIFVQILNLKLHGRVPNRIGARYNHCLRFLRSHWYFAKSIALAWQKKLLLNHHTKLYHYLHKILIYNSNPVLLFLVIFVILCVQVRVNKPDIRNRQFTCKQLKMFLAVSTNFFNLVKPPSTVSSSTILQNFTFSIIFKF